MHHPTGQRFHWSIWWAMLSLILLLAKLVRQLQSWQNAPSSPTATAQFLYDGQGQRVAQATTQGGTTTTTVSTDPGGGRRGSQTTVMPADLSNVTARVRGITSNVSNVIVMPNS
jgi:YD repeat-containing protein